MRVMTKIRILIYTDSTAVSDNNDKDERGVSILLSLLKQWRPAFAELEPVVVNRFKDPQAPQKLTKEFLDNFDQIWVLGLFQTNVDQDFNPTGYGGRENELDPAEQAALRNWMAAGPGDGRRGGGVLVTGDHSELDPNHPSDQAATFLCRGRALGINIPRAGKMRVWKGPPTNGSASDDDELVNSVSPGGKENDDQPQQLTLDALPHPLFLGRHTTISIFPDHVHEGRLDSPVLDSDWPSFNGIRPEPRVIAQGKNKVTSELYALLSAYDGDPVNVGRIVADTSWRHYMNLNLGNLDATSDDSAKNLMGQFFSNLAVWLAPLELRKEMGREMFKWLERNSRVDEERGNKPEKIGAVATQALSQTATQCEIHELLQANTPFVSTEQYTKLRFMPMIAELGAVVSREAMLGSVITEFQRATLPSPGSKAANTEELIRVGIAQAFR